MQIYNYDSSPTKISPKDPLPILRPSLNLPPTILSIRASSSNSNLIQSQLSSIKSSAVKQNLHTEGVLREKRGNDKTQVGL